MRVIYLFIIAGLTSHLLGSAAGAVPVAAAETPQVLRRVAPSYPSTATHPGRVVADLMISADGRVKAVTLIEETPLGEGYGAAATEAFWLWSFAPTSAAWTKRVAFNFVHPGSYALAEYTALASAPQPQTPLQPHYPYQALVDGVSGEVGAVIELDDEGNISRAQVMTERPTDYGFAGQALNNLRKISFPAGHGGAYRLAWRFDPAHPGQEDRLDTLPSRMIWPGPCNIDFAYADYPERARREKVGGQARVLIRLDDGGIFDGAQVLEDSSPVYGFAAAIVTRFEGYLEPTNLQPGLYDIACKFVPEYRP